MHAEFTILVVTDTHIVIRDNDAVYSKTITNDADYVIAQLQHRIDGGIKNRKVFYLDTMCRFDELVVKNGQFHSFKAGTANQQAFFQSLLNSRESHANF